MQQTSYHSLLRIFSLTIAIMLLFESGIVNPITKQISDDTRMYVASAIGMQASVSPNELNQLTAALTEQKNDLDKREAALNEREIGVNLNQSGQSSSVSTFILSAILFILLILIVLNYTLDFLRMQREREQTQKPA